MEYTLYSLYYFFQSFFGLLMTLEVVEGISVGGILVSVVVIGTVFVCLGIGSGGVAEENAHQKSIDLHKEIRSSYRSK